jgi:hypothetical protein
MKEPIDFEIRTLLKGVTGCYLCDPAGTRTQDPNIKSVVLYQLSYGIIQTLDVFWECKNRVIHFRSQTFKKNVFTSFHIFQL